MPNKGAYTAVRALLTQQEPLKKTELEILFNQLKALRKQEIHENQGSKDPITDHAAHYGQTLLMLALRHPHKKELIMAIHKAYPENVSHRNSDDADFKNGGYALGHSALMKAIELRNSDMVTQLLEWGADAKHVNEKVKHHEFKGDFYSLELAILRNETEIIKTLSSYGAQLTHQELLDDIKKNNLEAGSIIAALYYGAKKCKPPDNEYLKKLQALFPPQTQTVTPLKYEVSTSRFWRDPPPPGEIKEATKKPLESTATSASPGHKGPKPP